MTEPPLMERAVLKMKALSPRLSDALDAFAEAKVRNAVPKWRLNRAQREMNSLSPASACWSQLSGQDSTNRTTK
jgi:hypothetical protein